MIRLLLFLLSYGVLGQSLDSHLEAARAAEAAGNFASAEREYEAAIALRPSALAYQRLGLIRHLQNKFERAEEAFRRSLQLDPKQWSSRLFLGIDLYRTNRFDEAFTELRRAAAQRPDDPDTRFWLGATYLARRDYLAGLKTLEQLLREQPDNVEVLRLLAESYAAFGTTLLNTVAEKYPDTPAGLQVHAQALEFEGANDAALAVYRELQARSPHRPGVAQAIARLQAASAVPPRPSPPAAGDASPTPH